MPFSLWIPTYRHVVIIQMLAKQLAIIWNQHEVERQSIYMKDKLKKCNKRDYEPEHILHSSIQCLLTSWSFQWVNFCFFHFWESFRTYEFLIYFTALTHCNIPPHRFSGITAEDLEGVTTTLQDVQRDLQGIIFEDTILIGHGLASDFRALKVLKLQILWLQIMWFMP